MKKKIQYNSDQFLKAESWCSMILATIKNRKRIKI